jgi:hypothetical protein
MYDFKVYENYEVIISVRKDEQGLITHVLTEKNEVLTKQEVVNKLNNNYAIHTKTETGFGGVVKFFTVNNEVFLITKSNFCEENNIENLPIFNIK